MMECRIAANMTTYEVSSQKKGATCCSTTSAATVYLIDDRVNELNVKLDHKAMYFDHSGKLWGYTFQLKVLVLLECNPRP